MIRTTREIINELERLPIETQLLVVDENDREYVVDSIVKRKLYTDNDREWCYALNVRTTSIGCIKR